MCAGMSTCTPQSFWLGGGVECTLLNPFQFSDQIMQILLPYAKIDN